MPAPDDDRARVRSWLDSLPAAAEPSPTRPIEVEGFLLRQHEGRLELVVGGVTLEIDRADVRACSHVDTPAGCEAGYAPAVRLALRPGFRVHGLGSATPYRDLIARRRRPFSLAARPRPAPVAAGSRFRALEQAWLARHGLAPEPAAS